jgi:hypothetical protein
MSDERSTRLWISRWAAFLRANRWRVALVSVVVLIPCFWQPLIQAGDLASHVYNAWLVDLVRHGAAPGLRIEAQWTNVAFDLLLTPLFRVAGPWVAEHAAVSIAVLTFYWSAQALLWTIHRHSTWFLTPYVMLLSYGWVFHAGFFNFYLSIAFSLLVLAMLWEERRRDLYTAVPFAGLALLAHPLPVAWLMSTIAYLFVARRLARRWQLGLFVSAVVGLVAVHFALATTVNVQWSPRQALSATGFDQIIIHGRKDYLLGLMLALICGALLTTLREPRRCLTGLPAQVLGLAVVAVAALPEVIWLRPPPAAPLNFVATRMSVLAALFGCVFLGYARPNAILAGALSAFAVLRFGLLYIDARELNRIEGMVAAIAEKSRDRRLLFHLDWPAEAETDPALPYRIDAGIEKAVAALPFGSELLAGFGRDRIPWTTWYMVSRACIGRCYSYSNYEPSSGHFRVRASPPDTVVTSSARDAMAMGLGKYIVKPEDPPLFQIYRCSQLRIELCVRPLRAGEVNGRIPAADGSPDRLP